MQIMMPLNTTTMKEHGQSMFLSDCNLKLGPLIHLTEDLHVHSGAQVSKDKVTIVRKGGGWEPAEFVQIHMLKVKKCRGRTA